MKKFLLLIIMILFASSATAGEKIIISTGNEVPEVVNAIAPIVKVLSKYESTTIAEIHTDGLPALIKAAHDTGKCGGFFVHSSVEDAKASITASTYKAKLINYVVQDIPRIRTTIGMVREPEIRSTIEKLSSFHNRYYKSKHGVKASVYIKDTWEKYAKAELYNHKSYPQPSVIATIPGSTYPKEVIIVGGHLDSISGYFGGSTKRSPGADDNASGISTATEILRVLTETNYKPLRTIQFMGYAAEEVGLRGSAEVARDYKKRGIKVIGVMQLDMTNFKGSDKTIYLTTDYTDASQTDFLKRLIRTYLKVPYAETKCGYACSDHASWTKNSFRAVFPFEADKNGMNKKIHTKNDTIAVSGGNALHATNFARLGLAYVLEMDLQGVKVGSKQ